MPKPIAIIFNTTHRVTEFSPAKNAYRWHKYSLELKGYEVIEHNIKSSQQLEEILINLQQESLDFVWFRGHGAPKAINLAEQFNLTPDNLVHILKKFPIKLRKNATVFLDSCNTANLDKDFQNNMLFSFAKLTIDLPNVSIVGPKDLEHGNYFEIGADGNFKFYLCSPENYTHNIMVALGEHTKLLLKKGETTRELLLQSLNTDTRNFSCAPPEYISHEYAEAENNIPNKVKLAINHRNLSVFAKLIKFIAPDEFINGNEKSLFGSAEIGKKSLCLYILEKIYNTSDKFFFESTHIVESYLKNKGNAFKAQYTEIREAYRIYQSYDSYRFFLLQQNVESNANILLNTSFNR